MILLGAAMRLLVCFSRPSLLLRAPAPCLDAAVGRDWKGKLSPLLYLAGIASTAWLPWVAQGLYALAAIIWVVPDRRIEHALSKRET